MDALEKLRRVRRTNPDIAFLYVMRRDDDDAVRFVLDSDETDAPALPGREYEEAVDGMLRGFHEASVDDALVEDEWGVFLSGYAPRRHGDGRSIVGIDMRADEVKRQLSELRLSGMASLFVAMLLALLFALYRVPGSDAPHRDAGGPVSGDRLRTLQRPNRGPDPRRFRRPRIRLQHDERAIVRGIPR